MRNKPPQGGFILSLQKGGDVMPTLVEEAKRQGYQVTNIGGGFYKITNPATGKSTTAWEGVQYTGDDQLSHLGAPSTGSRTTSTSTSGTSSSRGSIGASSGGSSSSTNSHYQWLEQNWPGGAQQYIRSQQERYRQASTSGNRDLMARIEEDARRVGYSLPPIVQNVVEEAKQYTPTQQAAREYLRQTWPTGLEGYIKSQQQRYEEAVQNRDIGLIQRLIADAERVGYDLDLSKLAPLIQGQQQQLQQPQDQAQYLAERILQAITQPVQVTIPPEIQDIISQYRNYQPPPVLSWEEAQKRAEATLTPLYQQQLQERLRDVERDLIRRGLFGQMPSVPLTREETARIENARAAAIAQLANELIGRSETQARAAEEAARLRAATLSALLQGARQQATAEEQNRINQALSLLSTLSAMRMQPYQALLPLFQLGAGFSETLGNQWLQASREFGIAGRPYQQGNDTVPVRLYAISKGLGHLVDYDPTTDTVIIGRHRLSRADIENMGGRIENGITWLPPDIIEKLLSD